MPFICSILADKHNKIHIFVLLGHFTIVVVFGVAFNLISVLFRVRFLGLCEVVRKSQFFLCRYYVFSIFKDLNVKLCMGPSADVNNIYVRHREREMLF